MGLVNPLTCAVAVNARGTDVDDATRMTVALEGLHEMSGMRVLNAASRRRCEMKDQRIGKPEITEVVRRKLAA
jgi:hypothetical protein